MTFFLKTNLWMIIATTILFVVAIILHWRVPKREDTHPFFKNQRWNILDATLILIVADIFIFLDRIIVGLFLESKHTAFVTLIVSVLRSVLYGPMLLVAFWLFFHFKFRQSLMVLGISSHEWMRKVIAGLKWGILIPMWTFFVLFLLPVERASLLLKEKTLGHSEFNAYISYFGLPVAILLVVFYIVFMVTLEEVLHRGIYYSVLRKSINSVPAISISSVVFMLSHNRFNLGLLVLGCVCAYLYEKFHSLIPSITVHFTVNLFSYSLATLASSTTSSFSRFLNIGLGLSIVLLLITWTFSFYLDRRTLNTQKNNIVSGLFSCHLVILL